MVTRVFEVKKWLRKVSDCSQRLESQVGRRQIPRQGTEPIADWYWSLWMCVDELTALKYRATWVWPHYQIGPNHEGEDTNRVWTNQWLIRIMMKVTRITTALIGILKGALPNWCPAVVPHNTPKRGLETEMIVGWHQCPQQHVAAINMTVGDTTKQCKARASLLMRLQNSQASNVLINLPLVSSALTRRL